MRHVSTHDLRHVITHDIWHVMSHVMSHVSCVMSCHMFHVIFQVSCCLVSYHVLCHVMCHIMIHVITHDMTHVPWHVTWHMVREGRVFERALSLVITQPWAWLRGRLFNVFMFWTFVPFTSYCAPFDLDFTAEHHSAPLLTSLLLTRLQSGCTFPYYIFFLFKAFWLTFLAFSDHFVIVSYHLLTFYNFWSIFEKFQGLSGFW